VARVTHLLAGLAVIAAAGALAVSALAAPGDPKLAIRPADQGYARTILLTPAELAGKGWKSKPRDFSNKNSETQSQTGFN
jgi:hypothetical protein